MSPVEETPGKKRVLLWVLVDTHFREMLRVARLLKDHPVFEPFFLFQFRYPVFEQDLNLCRAEGFSFLDLTGSSPGDGTDSVAKPLLVRLKEWARTVYRAAVTSWLADWLLPLRLWIAYRNCRRQVLQAGEILDRTRPALMVMPEDNVEFNTAAMIKLGRERSIPTVIIPYTLANAREPAEVYWNNPAHRNSRLSNLLLGFFCPQWLYLHRGRKLVRLPAERALMQQYYGLAPAKPWLFNSSNATVIAVESDAVFDYYTRAGLPGEQFRVTGSLRLDELARQVRDPVRQRQQLMQELNLEDNGPLVLCALPPDQRPDRRPSCEFRSYPELVAFWARSLGGLRHCTIMVNLHPRLPYDEYRYIEQWGVRIVPGDIARLIPLCDVYVASVSATIALAIACGKVVINYDVYRFAYDDFAGVEQVLTMDSKEGFLEALQRCTRPGSSQPIEKASRSWGVLDGKAGVRLLKLFEEVLQPASRQLQKQCA